jgi:hypothetical protein
MSVAVRKNLKLSPRFYGPYQILEKMRVVSYKLNLLSGSKIHSVFHVSLLKKQVGTTVVVQDMLPYVDNAEGKVLPRLKVALEYRTKKGITEVLVHWEGLSPADSTWENFNDMQLRFPSFVLEDKDNFKGKGVLRTSG